MAATALSRTAGSACGVACPVAIKSSPDAERLELDGDWARHATQFEPAVLDKAVAAMNYMSRYRWFVKYMLERDTVFYPIRSLVQVLRRAGVVEGG